MLTQELTRAILFLIESSLDSMSEEKFYEVFDKIVETLRENNIETKESYDTKRFSPIAYLFLQRLYLRALDVSASNYQMAYHDCCVSWIE